jgi:hypothetical protein
MSNIHTLTELDKVVTKETYDTDIKKLAKICKDINDKYLAEARKNIKGNKMVEILAEKLKTAMDELNKLKNQPQVVSVNNESLFAQFNNAYFKEHGFSKEEKDKLYKEAEDQIKSMGF